MAIFRSNPGDAAAFKLLLFLTIMYGLMYFLAYSVMHMKFITPLGVDAPFDKFSEGRALEHLQVLSKDIGPRQEGRPGLKLAADYITGQLESLKDRANSNFRIEVDESMVNGSFNMKFLGHSISTAYRAHKNVLMRISSVNSTESDASVLINGHFDSALNSPGAADCGSCVASMLELARLIVDSGWIPPQPIIFLFNGAEELFLLGSHGFVTTHKWRDTVGAFINLEASGSGGPGGFLLEPFLLNKNPLGFKQQSDLVRCLDVVCQSGPGSWPSLVYAQSAAYPMALSGAEDIFGIIPGDTDYRMLAKDYGDIPGLDIIYLLGGYYYHTSHDTMERLLPGNMQARGDNLFGVVKAFTINSMLRNASERQSDASTAKGPHNERAVFFDFFTWFMVYYPRRIAVVLHILPAVVFLVLPIFLCMTDFGLRSCCATVFDLLKGMMLHFSAIVMAVIVPVIFAISKLLFSSHAMNWYAHPYLAFMMFIPGSLVGLLIPRYVWRHFHLSQDISVQKMSIKVLANEAWFWGSFGFYAVFTLVYLLVGLSGGFLTFLISASLLLAWICTQLCCSHGQSLRFVVVYILPLLPCLMYMVQFTGLIMQFLIEKMGMMGSIAPPLGYYMQDIIVAAIVGVLIGLCVGPLLPIISSSLARSSVMQLLLHLSVLSLGVSSIFFPYSVDAPKRVVMQHTILTRDSTQIMDSSYEFSVVDSNSILYLFKHAREASEQLQMDSGYSFEPSRERWLALFPVNFLFSKSLKFPAGDDAISKQYKLFPHVSIVGQEEISPTGTRKVHLELDLGSVKELWVTVLNITGPLSSWSFADNKLPAPESIDDGPPSYICRLSGASHEKWTFWLEANGSEPLRVEVAALDQYLAEPTKQLKDLFPDWTDVVAYTSFISSYSF